MKEKVLSMISGGLMGVVASIGEEAAKVFMLGIIGAVGGLVGRELYNFLKELTKKLWRKRK